MNFKNQKLKLKWKKTGQKGGGKQKNKKKRGNYKWRNGAKKININNFFCCCLQNKWLK